MATKKSKGPQKNSKGSVKKKDLIEGPIADKHMGKALDPGTSAYTEPAETQSTNCHCVKTQPTGSACEESE